MQGRSNLKRLVFIETLAENLTSKRHPIQMGVEPELELQYTEDRIQSTLHALYEIHKEKGYKAVIEILRIGREDCAFSEDSEDSSEEKTETMLHNPDIDDADELMSE